MPGDFHHLDRGPLVLLKPSLRSVPPTDARGGDSEIDSGNALLEGRERAAGVERRGDQHRMPHAGFFEERSGELGILQGGAGFCLHHDPVRRHTALDQGAAVRGRIARADNEDHRSDAFAVKLRRLDRAPLGLPAKKDNRVGFFRPRFNDE